MSGAKPYATVAAADLAERTAPLSWLVDGLFLKAGAGILGGAPKTGKSFFALDLCVAVASQTACADRFVVSAAGPVLLLCAEDPEAVVVARLKALCRPRGRSLAELPIDVIDEAVRLPDGIDRLAATLALRRPSLLLLDPLIRLHRADENSAAEMSIILDGVRNLARGSGTAILLVHHTRKAAASSSGAALRGSSDLAAFGDTNLFLRKLGQGMGTDLELKIEHRAAASPPPYRCQLAVDGDAAARFRAAGQGHGHTGSPDPIDAVLLAALAGADEPLSSAALRKKLGVRNQTVAEALARLRDQGRVCRAGRDGWRAETEPV
jgi:biotin operon repressor